MKKSIVALALLAGLFVYSNSQAQVFVSVGSPWMGPGPVGWHGGFYAPRNYWVHPAHRGFYPRPHFRGPAPRPYFRGPVRPVPRRRW